MNGQRANRASLTDTRALLTDVVTTPQEAVDASDSPGKHHAVIAIVERILAGRNGVRQ